MNQAQVKFQLKAVGEGGSFEGLAAVYGNVDLGKDIIEPGAFTKTLNDKGGEVPILWQHDSREPIGKGKLTDSEKGLIIAGQLVLESDVATKAYALMKADILKGLSIGYDTVVSEYDRATEVRKLKELRLWEVSLVTFPMNPKAQVTNVKAHEEALENAVTDLHAVLAELKAGRTISAGNMERMRRAHGAIMQGANDLSALMDEVMKSAAKQSPEPGIHSAFNALEATLKSFRA